MQLNVERNGKTRLLYVHIFNRATCGVRQPMGPIVAVAAPG